MMSLAPMKIYTKTGDDGTTGLIGGQRAPKSNPRFDCIGAIDELNAALGCAAATAAAASASPSPLVEQIHIVQSDLFTIGSHLAVPESTPIPSYLPALEEATIARLEMEIDAAEADLPPLRNFILPGGTPAAAHLHLARTICRRAERLLVAFAQDRPISATVLTYLNRLSDWLFVQARHANHQANVPDIPWRPAAK